MEAPASLICIEKDSCTQKELQCPGHNVSATSSWEVSINYCAPFRSTLVSGSAVMRYCLRFLSCRHQSGRYSTVIYCNKPYTAHKRDSTFPGKASQRMQQDPEALLAPLLPLLPLQHNARRPTCSRCMPTGYTCCNPARCQQTAAGHCPNNICPPCMFSLTRTNRFFVQTPLLHFNASACVTS
jgi:hypothetical protein